VKTLNNGIVMMTGNGAGYDGSKTGHELDNWRTQLSDPNDFITNTYGELSSRNATLYNTAAYARAAIRKPLSYSIGDGLFFRSLPDAKFLGIDREEMVEWSQKFTSLLHYDKLEMNYYEKQSLLCAEASITGDSLLYFIREDNGYDFDLVATGGHTIDWKNTDPSKNIGLGIQTDELQRRTGFYVPGQDSVIPFMLDGGENSIGFQNAIQVFLQKERTGQLRGYGVNNSMIALLKNMDSVWDATIQRMVLESIMLGFSKATETNVPAQARNMAKNVKAVQNKVQESSESGNALQKIGEGAQPGEFYNLKNEESIEFTKLETPSNNFGNANEWAIRNVAMARGVSPEFLKTEYGGSFTAHKGALNDTFQTIKNERGSFVRNTDSKVNLELLKGYILSGELTAPPAFWENSKRGARVRNALLKGKTLGPVPGHINPLQEAKADKLKVDERFILRSDVQVKDGSFDGEAFDAQWLEEDSRWGTLTSEQQTKEFIKAEENK